MCNESIPKYQQLLLDNQLSKLIKKLLFVDTTILRYTKSDEKNCKSICLPTQLRKQLNDKTIKIEMFNKLEKTYCRAESSIRLGDEE